MGRFLLGVGLMAALLMAGLWVWKGSEEIHAPVTRALTQAAENARSGEYSLAMETALGARKMWESRWHRVAAISDHNPMDEIDGLFAQLESCSGTELAALCSRISSLVSAVAEVHSLTWWNLL